MPQKQRAPPAPPKLLRRFAQKAQLRIFCLQIANKRVTLLSCKRSDEGK
jgi:hypothetical protein